MKKLPLPQFKDDMDEIMKLLEEGKEEEARENFNRKYFEEYNQLTHDLAFGSESDVEAWTAVFFLVLDEYLNNPSARMVGLSTYSKLKSDYREFQDDVKALEEKRKQTGN
ncbi:MAG TPA: hypothetical protein VFM02_03665 [Candidatus Paceibacterota bacterium]|nr:hypothetical protein [Candidatus Paceibacterota bacterium]